ncbi:oxidoreductase-like protein [Tothia fuscella]|uniref:Oxidoreductase-like protein n=1 Tax=Tothia fuscella TaxID=1048955 RepID=A0A9P4TX82_9PEZI|nr:oxidoreductase-like protein [Tothia fuscella]
MASVFLSRPWHTGETRMHTLMNVPENDNPTAYTLTPQAAYLLQRAPLLALGTLDSEGRPWTTLLGGENGFARPLGGDMVGLRVDVDAEFDPVVEVLVPRGRRGAGEVVKGEEVERGKGLLVGGLTIDLMTRKRVKIAGRMVVGAVSGEGSDKGERMGVGEMQLVCKIEQSLGNCPKYLNKKDIRPAPAHPKLISKSAQLSPEGIALLAKADLFFISSSNSTKDMDTNHRGGPPGFVRLLANDISGAQIVYPEYSGNRLYQTLGNLVTTSKAGIVIPDFETGDVLYITGTTEILIGKDANTLLPHSNLAVKITITEARFVEKGLPFRGIVDEFSPYNPNVRLLAMEEGSIASKLTQATNTAKLLSREDITPTIARYKFAMTNPVPYKPGQWVALDFSEELDVGYSHMRDDDPQSLNDDFVRTFTVSSSPLGTTSTSSSKPHDEFEITLRRHGPVTAFLSRVNPKSGLEIPLKGFGGDFVIGTSEEDGVVPFVAGGVGITPVLGQLRSLDLERFRLVWVIRAEDVSFVVDVLGRERDLARVTSVFFTGNSSSEKVKEGIQQVVEMGATVHIRRPQQADFDALDAQKWYMCAGRPLRDHILDWLKGKKVLFENFDY